MTENLKWESKPTEAILETSLQQLMDSFTEISESIGGVLDGLSAGLSAAKILVSNDINPAILALTFILDQMIQVVVDLKNSGIYLMSIYPSAEVHTSSWKHNEAGFVLYKDIFPGFDDGDGAGFFILNTEDIFKKFLESFDDENDLDRPPTGAAVQAGGIVIFAGALPKELIKAGETVKEIMKSFKSIADLFTKLFNVDAFRKLKNDLNKKLVEIEEAAVASTSGSTRTIKKVVPVPPNWAAKRIAKDLIPALGDVLEDVEGILKGFKDQQSAGSQALITSMVAFIDAKIVEITSIKTKITEFMTFITGINTAFSELGKLKLSTLVVPVQEGGINILKSAVADTTLDGRPVDNLYYCSLIGLVGAGTGFAMLMFLLGLSDTFAITTDTTSLSDESLRERFGI